MAEADIRISVLSKGATIGMVWDYGVYSVRYYSAKVDIGQPEIVEALRKTGCYVLHVHRLKNCCDLIVMRQGDAVAVEIKGRRKKLSEGEAEFRGLWEGAGGRYEIVSTPEEALAIFGIGVCKCGHAHKGPCTVPGCGCQKSR